MKKSRIVLLALALSSVPALSAATRSAPPAEPSLAAVAQDSEFTKLETEYKEARKAWDAAVKEAKAKGEKAPKRIESDFWARFEALASKGEKGAAAWCVANLRYGNLSNADIQTKVPPLFDKLVDAMLKDEASEEPFSLGTLIGRILPGALGQKYLTAEQVEALLAKVEKNAKLDESKAAAMLMALTLPNLGIEDDDEREQKNLPAYKAVAEKFPKTASGRTARGEVNRLENLAVGKVAPDFTTTDVEGVEFKLSDYRGKVVVLDFWGFW